MFSIYLSQINTNIDVKFKTCDLPFFKHLSLNSPYFFIFHHGVILISIESNKIYGYVLYFWYTLPRHKIIMFSITNFDKLNWIKTLFWEVLMEAQSGICFVKSKMPFSRVKNQCHSFDKHDDFDFQINS